MTTMADWVLDFGMKQFNNTIFLETFFTFLTFKQLANFCDVFAGLIKRGFDFELMRHLATSSKNF